MTRIERKYFISWRSKQVYIRGGKGAGRKKMLTMLRKERWPAKQGSVTGKNEIWSSEGRWVLISVEAPHFTLGSGVKMRAHEATDAFCKWDRDLRQKEEVSLTMFFFL